VSELKDKPAGTVRITSTENAADAILWPTLRRVLPDHPDIKVEIVIDYGLTDIVTEQVDAGVRPGETVAKDMIAVPIGPDMRMAVVGSPAYFAKRPPPRTPQELTQHNCINLRLPVHRGIYAWGFERNGRDLRVRVDGQLTFNTAALLQNAALQGLWAGVSHRAAGQGYLDSGELVACLPAGARPSQDIISIIQAAASLRQRSPCCSTRCAIRHPPRRHGNPDQFPPRGRENSQARRTTARGFRSPRLTWIRAPAILCTNAR
jgi:DNA-binding transcriptional LysR family regulator